MENHFQSTGEVLKTELVVDLKYIYSPVGFKINDDCSRETHICNSYIFWQCRHNTNIKNGGRWANHINT